MDLKIMMVDDEADFLEVMAKFFRRRQVELVTATSCQQALGLLAATSFDVVIMDVSMPGRGGLECMADVKALYPTIEVIVLTGHASLDAGLIGMRQGAFDYCLKPVDFDELFEKIILAGQKVEVNRIPGP